MARIPAKLTTLLDTALLRLGSQCAIDPAGESDETWRSLARATQVANAIFAAATESADHVDCLIGEEFYAIPATGPTYYSDPKRWQTALWLAVIARDFDRIQKLTLVDENTLRANSDDYDEYVYPWIGALQSYFSGDAGEVPEKLAAASELIAPENVTRSSPERIEKIVSPQLLLFLELASRNEEEFNDVLVEALVSHRDFWTADDERRTNPVGFVALAPLAFAASATDAGFHIGVESGYLPRGLLNGSRVGEFQF
ncbi:immunity 49 family protein [Saccharopolyspora sp. K220]|uniref:immunity 49 family protein n=1 Tax=Saccharopolyspora soli TaxID=2926618 RepID=UPI001F56EE1F|nr:immunity 49 family protein [Saccharopolyspora soli]MCI2421204.1 immunity 49 family protein [Saccharopolyspora soli]